jgi:hypothetical protein
MKRNADEKRSNLFDPSASDRGKSLITLTLGVNVIKLVFFFIDAWSKIS